MFLHNSSLRKVIFSCLETLNGYKHQGGGGGCGLCKMLTTRGTFKTSHEHSIEDYRKKRQQDEEKRKENEKSKECTVNILSCPNVLTSCSLLCALC